MVNVHMGVSNEDVTFMLSAMRVSMSGAAGVSGCVVVANAMESRIDSIFGVDFM